MTRGTGSIDDEASGDADGCREMEGVMFRLGALVFAALLLPAIARAQSMTGSWQLVVDEVSNTCGEPLGSAEASVVDVLQAGDLFVADGPGGLPDQTPIDGKRSGSDLTLGFEVFEDGGATIYDPADTALTLNPAVTTFAGTVAWAFYAPGNCTGTQTWTATRPGAATPGTLTAATWTINAVETSDSCDPIDPTPVPFSASIVQSGSLVEIVAPDFGQTRIRGQVSGSTLRLGLGIRDEDGAFTVFDQGDNALAINSGFTSFSGTMSWRSFDGLVCTGIDAVVGYLPEPGSTIGLLVGFGAMLGVRRPRMPRIGHTG
jgi:hypothetical protein